MKISLRSVLIPLLTAVLSLHAQEQPVDLATGLPGTGPGRIQAELADDSDGDLIPDGIDPNYLIPDSPEFSWWISDVTVGWDLDQSRIDQLDGTTGTETITQRKTSFTIGGGIGGGGGASHGINSDPSALFLSLLPGGNLLKKAGDGFKSQSHLAVSFQLNKSLDRTRTVKEIRSEFHKLEQKRAITNRHIEFTVEFFNSSGDAFQFRNFSIPVQTSSRQTRAEAMCFVGGELIQDFEVPANRPSGYPVRFRAMLSTTQSEQILDALESGELRLAMERSNGQAINQTSEIDEIARRQQMSSQVEDKTVPITFSTAGSSTTWRVARHNQLTGRATTVGEALTAINRMAASNENPDYIEISGNLIYAVGSYRNTPQNAFEVTNASLSPLKIVSWSLMDRYGVVQNGAWNHGLERPLDSQGVHFSYHPHQLGRDSLPALIHQLDPSLSSEWLALCHFWLTYDPARPFIEYPLSITDYPLAPFLRSLPPGFARANFEKMVSNWISPTRPQNSIPIEDTDFLEKVRIHRKEILDAAFDGYSEASALLARIPEPMRDEMENNAVRTAVLMGNTDTAAVESISQILRDLDKGVAVDLNKVSVPDHVFSKNLLGFLRFAECNRGLTPGQASEGAHRAFTYSSDLGDPFACSMKGWLHLNLARYKRGKLINRPHWPRDRDVGLSLLEEVASRSLVANYVLADLYHSNRLDVPTDPQLARSYLRLAADRRFADAEALYRKRYGG